jgi:hypothetical protein
MVAVSVCVQQCAWRRRVLMLAGCSFLLAFRAWLA